jgi:hypothetical protein
LTPELVIFSFYINKRMLDDTFTLCKKISTMRPDNRNLHEWPVTLYEFRGQKREAEKERAEGDNRICAEIVQ